MLNVQLFKLMCVFLSSASSLLYSSTLDFLEPGAALFAWDLYFNGLTNHASFILSQLLLKL